MKEFWIAYMYDWSLSKGAPPPISPSRVSLTIETTSIHKIVEESTTETGVSLMVESDISREDFNAIAKGHRVNGIPLTTPSVYAEIALSLGRYLVGKYQPTMKDVLVDVADLVVEKALIPHSQGPQILRISTKVDWTIKRGELRFDSVNDAGKVIVEHGHCSIIFGNRDRLKMLQQKVPEYVARIDYLRREANNGRVLRLNKIYAYKLVSSLAQFHPDYVAADEVTLDSRTLEASSTCSFGQVVSKGNFSTHPVYIDVMTQTAGFVMNAKETTDLEVEVFVNHGWESLQIFEEITAERSYVTYVKMAQDGEFWRGDTIMLDGLTVVAFFKGVTLRSVPRKGFHMVLDAANPKKANKATRATPAAKISPPTAIPKLTKPANSTPRDPAKKVEALPQPTIQPPVQPVQEREVSKAAILAPATSKANIQLTRALNIISEETGIAASDLTDDSNFTEIGVDSLLSMVISSRFREELGLDLDLEFSLFLDLPTVKDLRNFIQPTAEDVPVVEVVPTTEPVSPEPPEETALPIQTPSRNQSWDDFVKVEVAVEQIELNIQQNVVEAPSDLDGPLGPALNIVAEESGLDIADLTDDTNFAEIGVDSLLSMVISSKYTLNTPRILNSLFQLVAFFAECEAVPLL